MTKDNMRFGPDFLFVVVVVGILFCTLPMAAMSFKNQIDKQNFTISLTSDAFHTALIVGIVSTVPMFIELFFDRSATSNKDEKQHWICRFYLLVTSIIPNIILVIVMGSKMSKIARLFTYVALMSFRYLVALSIVLYFFAKCLQTNHFTLQKSTIILCFFIASRFGAVMLIMHPERAFYGYINGFGYGLGTVYFIYCSCNWWLFARRLERKNKDHSEKSAHLCSRIYILGTIANLIIIPALPFVFSTTTAEYQGARNAKAITALLYAHFAFVVIITTIPGRYARLENIAAQSDKKTKKTFIRFVSHEIRGANLLSFVGFVFVCDVHAVFM
jgi:hypothetical protein